MGEFKFLEKSKTRQANDFGQKGRNFFNSLTKRGDELKGNPKTEDSYISWFIKNLYQHHGRRRGIQSSQWRGQWRPEGKKEKESAQCGANLSKEDSIGTHFASSRHLHRIGSTSDGED